MALLHSRVGHQIIVPRLQRRIRCTRSLGLQRTSLGLTVEQATATCCTKTKDNPGHGDGGNQALWGLAKPFPRIVQPKRSSGHATKPSKALYPQRDDRASAPIPGTQLALQISNTSARGTEYAQRAQYHHVLVDDPSQEPGWSATKIPFSGMRRRRRLGLRMQ
jgi:hypothetical protein